MKKRSLLVSIMTLVLCLVLISGATFALFTSESEVNIAVTSGKVSLTASVDKDTLKTYSLGEEQAYGKFQNGGTAKLEEVKTADISVTEQVLKLELLTPGDKATFNIKINNQSSVKIKYRLTLSIEGELAPALVSKAQIDGTTLNFDGKATPWVEVEALEKISDILFEVELPIETGNEYQEKEATITVFVEATQSNDPNAINIDEWDGTSSYDWYLENPEAETFTLNTAEQLSAFANLVQGVIDDPNIPASIAESIELPVTFAGKTVKLAGNVDLYYDNKDEDPDPETFKPIGNYNNPFEGTFDGQGFTISNLFQNGWALGYEWGSYGSIGLFGYVNNATIKNVNIKGAEALVEGGDVGGITGSAEGTCVFENITIEDSVFATYNNGNGGIIGWSGQGHYTFKNITISDDVVLAGLWGSFDSSIGGVVGQGEPGATYIFDNVDVACRLDVYNDCTASYDYYNYRMCGMLIGRLAKTTTIDGANYPDVSKYNIVCNDVTVTYGEWANYHYCREEGQRAKRVEAGYSYGGVASDYDHSVCTLHHMELIAFDQIFGGDQYAVKGLKSYENVEVVYNNK